MSTARRVLNARVGAAAVALAVGLITVWEGYTARVSYDPIGRLAVCYGHDDQSMVKGRFYSKAECEAILDADLLLHAEVLNCLPDARGKLTDGQRGALVSFAYNVGVPKACGSTFVKRLNAGDGKAACAELSKWVYAGGRALPGLVNRRKAERKVCES
jgi:lysozyme